MRILYLGRLRGHLGTTGAAEVTVVLRLSLGQRHRGYRQLELRTDQPFQGNEKAYRQTFGLPVATYLATNLFHHCL
jgi:hypothetical protein